MRERLEWCSRFFCFGDPSIEFPPERTLTSDMEMLLFLFGFAYQGLSRKSDGALNW